MSDTLQLDTLQLARFQHDARFDYDRELVGGGETMMQWLMRTVREWLSDNLNVALDSDVVYYSLLAVGIMAVLLIVFLVVWRRGWISLRRDEKGGVDYELEEDTIYDVDFDARLAEAERRADWRQAVRLLYLQTLKLLNDSGRIEFLLSKTPAQYVREANDPAFTRLSTDFVRIRYGNFEATEALFRDMQAAQLSLVNTQNAQLNE